MTPQHKNYLMSTPAPCFYSVFNNDENRLQIQRMQLWCQAALHRFKQVKK